MQYRNANAASRYVEMRNLRFPQKLWVIVNDNNGIAEWSRNGSSITLDIEALDTYLQSDESIFRMRNHCSFERHMLLYGFKRIGSHTSTSSRSGVSAKDPDEMEFRNESFKRDRPYLVDSIRQCPVTNEQNLNILRSSRTERNDRLHTHNDPCRRLRPKVWSSCLLKSARFRLRTVLLERYVRAMLSQKLDRCVRTNDWSIELEADVFENAVDSVSGFEQREVAGFYGHNVNSEQIKSFFGEYLPTYSNDDGQSSLNATVTKNQESFSHFEIIANDPKCTENIEYSLHPIHESNDKPTVAVNLEQDNQLIPIHYDPSYADNTMVGMENSLNTDRSDHIKEEYMMQSRQKDDEDNFEFDQFFLMKPKENEPDMINSMTLPGTQIKQEETKESNDLQIDSIETNNDQITEANDIIQQAAIIDDDFFSQIRESMDVLYDKVLC